MDWLRKTLNDIGGEGTSAQVIGGLIVAALLGLVAFGWRRLVRKWRASRVEADCPATESAEPPSQSNPLRFAERRILARMYSSQRTIRILRRAGAPAAFVTEYGSREGCPDSLAADRWFFVLKGLVARGLVSHQTADRGEAVPVEVFTLSDKGVERCLLLFGGPIRASAKRVLAWLAEYWGFLVMVAFVALWIWWMVEESQRSPMDRYFDNIERNLDRLERRMP